MTKQRHRAVKGLAQGHTAETRWGHFKQAVWLQSPRAGLHFPHHPDFGVIVHALSHLSPSSHLCPVLEKQALKLPPCLAPPSPHWPSPSTSPHAPGPHPKPASLPLAAMFPAQLSSEQVGCCFLCEDLLHTLLSESPRLCRPLLSHGEFLPL